MRCFAALNPEPTVGPQQGVKLQGGTFQLSGLTIGNGPAISQTGHVSIWP
jgi:hypothetical protein